MVSYAVLLMSRLCLGDVSAPPLCDIIAVKPLKTFSPPCSSGDDVPTLLLYDVISVTLKDDVILLNLSQYRVVLLSVDDIIGINV